MHLRSTNTDPDLVEWDAWRREDGRWTLTGRYDTARRAGLATFTFDARGSFVTLEDDDARWLVGEAVPDAAALLDAAPDAPAGRVRRLSSVPGEDVEPGLGVELGDDAIELVSDGPVTLDPDADPGTEPVGEPAVPAAGDPSPAPGTGAPAHDDGQLELPTGDEDEDEPVAEQPARRTVSKKRGRASVPSWDEIMFGGRDQ